MSHDVASDRLLWINSVAHCRTWVSHDLIAHEYSNIELLTQFLHSVEGSAKDLLSFRQLTSTGEIDPKRRHD